MRKILEVYPFAHFQENPITIAEGFSCYTGRLGDKKGDPHKGIDYVKEMGAGVFVPFGVHTAHDGRAVWGEEESFGNFVMVCSMIEADSFYLTVYAHLQVIAQEGGLFFMPKYKPKKRKGFWPEKPLDEGIPLVAGTHLGDAGTTGWTNNLIQLHFELHEFTRVGRKWERKKIDPYGVYDDIDSGKYPQPSEPLSLCPNHFWASDTPSFA